MEVEEEGAGSGVAGDLPDPEKGPAGAAGCLRALARKALQEELQKVVTCIMDNITKQSHLPSAKLLFEMAGAMQQKEGISQVAMESFAQKITKDYQYWYEGRTGSEEGRVPGQSGDETTSVTDGIPFVGVG